jgi:hypothetical protein
VITVYTILYDSIKKRVLNENNWFNTFKHDMVEEKIIGYNNLITDDDTIKKINILKDKGIKFFNIEEYSNETLKNFNINLSKTDKAYKYTVPFLFGLYICKSDYLLTVSADCTPNITNAFIKDSIKILEQNDVLSTVPRLNIKDGEVVDEKYMLLAFNKVKRQYVSNIEKPDNFYLTGAFSDQVFFTKTSEINKIDYNLPDSKNIQTPSYGGKCFERRVGNYLQSNKIFRAIYEFETYNHNK